MDRTAKNCESVTERIAEYTYRTSNKKSKFLNEILLPIATIEIEVGLCVH